LIMSSNTDGTAGELRVAEYALRRLGKLRLALTYSECLRVAELLRDAADALDHGRVDHPRFGEIITLPISRVRPPAIAENTGPATVQVSVRPLAVRRPPARPARPRNTVAAT
jgi:hypothetical protein